MDIKDMIDRYGLRLATRFDGGKLVKTGNILISRPQQVQKDNALADIKAAKPEIIACLEAQEAAERAALEERERKIAAIPGLKEIQAAREDVAAWNKEFRESFEDVGGLGVRKKPEYDFDALFAKYPVAAAYLKALSYSMSTNDAKASAGKAAIDAILSGADSAAAIQEMESAWKNHCMNHMWN